MKPVLAFLAAVLTLAAVIILVSGAGQSVYRPEGNWAVELTATDVASSGFTIIGSTGITLATGGNEQQIVTLGNGPIVNVTICTTSGDLVAFKVERQSSPNGGWRTYLSGTDFDTATSSLPFIESEGPHEIESDECAMFDMDVRGAYAFRLSATSDLGNPTSSVTAFIGLRQN